MGCIGGAIVGGLAGLLVALLRVVMRGGGGVRATTLDIDSVVSEACPKCGSLQVERGGSLVSCNSCGELTDLAAR